MKRLAIALLLAGCGGKATPPPSEPTPQLAPAPDKPASELQRRQDAACERLGPKLTQCAAADAKADLAAGKTSKEQYDKDTAQAVLAKNTEEFERQCKESQMSSRQVRVLEVCFREESECEPLRKCLENLKPVTK